MRTIHATLLAVITWHLFGTSVASAAPLNYSEDINGELPSSPNGALPILELDAGTNFVSGNARWIADDLDFDQFRIRIQPLQVLTTVTLIYDVSVVGPLQSAIFYTGFSIISGKKNLGDQLVVMYHFDPEPYGFVLSPSPVEMFNALLPLKSGDYLMQHSGLARSSDTDLVPLGGEYDYQWRFEVANLAVSEPSPLLMLGFAVVAFGFVYRRGLHQSGNA